MKRGENLVPLPQSVAEQQKTTYRRVAPKPMEESYEQSMMQQTDLSKAPLPMAMPRYLDPSARPPIGAPGAVSLAPLGSPMVGLPLQGAPPLVQPYVLSTQSFRSLCLSAHRLIFGNFA